MKREKITQILVFLGLVLAGVGLRVYFQYLPNFAPVAALALFAGYYFRSPAVALAVPLSVMILSDQLIGGYNKTLMLSVYAMLSLPVAMRTILRKHLTLTPDRRLARSVAGLVGCSLFASVAFFVVTNLVTFCVSDFYAKTMPELVRCYVQAIPFFRYTLLGDGLFAAVLFGGYALGWRLLHNDGRVSHQASLVSKRVSLPG